jgi:hypothetical protein
MLSWVSGETIADVLKARSLELFDPEGKGSRIFRKVVLCTPNFVWETHPKT